MYKIYILLFSICTLSALGKTPEVGADHAVATDSTLVVYIDPPFLHFYTKYIDAVGIPVRSASLVEDKALYIARNKVMMMLRHMDNARKNLVQNGAELHIIGRDQQTSDLPEHAAQKGVKYLDHGVLTNIDARTRGVGGLYASCGEENLLGLANDRYAGGSDICVHEFAHTIMMYGLDDALRAKIKQKYQHAKDVGLWKDAYATSDEGEYWAELSMWYFGRHGEFLRGTQLPKPGAEGLREYDAGGYKLLDSIYSGLLQPKLTGTQSIMVQKGAVSLPSKLAREFTFTNNRSADVRLYWIDFAGNAKFYRDIKPKEHITQQTYATHVWMFADDKDQPIAYIRVNDPPCDIALRDNN